MVAPKSSPGTIDEGLAQAVEPTALVGHAAPHDRLPMQRHPGVAKGILRVGKGDQCVHELAEIVERLARANERQTAFVGHGLHDELCNDGCLRGLCMGNRNLVLLHARKMLTGEREFDAQPKVVGRHGIAAATEQGCVVLKIIEKRHGEHAREGVAGHEIESQSRGSTAGIGDLCGNVAQQRGLSSIAHVEAEVEVAVDLARWFIRRSR